VLTPGNDLLSDHCQEIDSQVLFYGNRIRKKGKDEEKVLFEAFYDVFSSFVNFLKERKETICDWRGTQDGAGAAAFFASECSGAGATPNPNPQPVTVPKAAPAEEKK